jgi:hypothetical protein
MPSLASRTGSLSISSSLIALNGSSGDSPALDFLDVSGLLDFPGFFCSSFIFVSVLVCICKLLFDGLGLELSLMSEVSIVTAKGGDPVGNGSHFATDFDFRDVVRLSTRSRSLLLGSLELDLDAALLALLPFFLPRRQAGEINGARVLEGVTLFLNLLAVVVIGDGVMGNTFVSSVKPDVGAGIREIDQNLSREFHKLINSLSPRLAGPQHSLLVNAAFACSDHVDDLSIALARSLLNDQISNSELRQTRQSTTPVTSCLEFWHGHLDRLSRDDRGLGGFGF